MRAEAIDIAAERAADGYDEADSGNHVTELHQEFRLHRELEMRGRDCGSVVVDLFDDDVASPRRESEMPMGEDLVADVASEYHRHCDRGRAECAGRQISLCEVTADVRHHHHLEI